MKLNRKSLRSIVYFGASFANLSIALPISKIASKKNQKRIILYGHKFNGNLKCFYDFFVQQNKYPAIEVYYLTLDYAYYKKIKEYYSNILCGEKPLDMLKLANSDILVTDHGPGFFHHLKKFRPELTFIDVWHGVGFKRQTREDFKLMRSYERIFASSKFFKNIYCSEWGFKKEQLVVTGYSRTDPLVKKSLNKKAILDELEIGSKYKKIILFCPTYSHFKNESNFVTNLENPEFIRKMEYLGEKYNAVILIRPHLNTDLKTLKEIYRNNNYLKLVSMEDFPETNKILWITDLIITDWSSIVSEFLILNRPVIFLDLPPPFEGHTLGPGDRIGYIAKNEKELLRFIEISLKNPQNFRKKFGLERKNFLRKCFGDTLDGRCANRYADIIFDILHINPSNYNEEFPASVRNPRKIHPKT